jgi:hypothetical protein
MSVNEYLPFLDFCRTIKSYDVEDFDLYDKRYLTFNIPYDVKVKSILKKIEEDSGIKSGFYVEIARIMPNDIFVYLGKSIDLITLLKSSKRPKTVNAHITELDYGRLCKQIKLVDEEGLIKARLSKNYKYTYSEVKSTKFIEDAHANKKTELTEPLVKTINKCALKTILTKSDYEECSKKK